jgi:bacterioferritin (cytochrome b1)
MIREDLVAERVAIESYGEIIRYLGENDPTTRRCSKRSWRSRRSTPRTSRP